ncbi:ribosomal lysine N-methyltransferase set11 [Dichotomopilus funicola]|uniref:Ribosomal lysine N-methyltransferase set11 n=1 Tax=Dichotomopilus funicola TaxID=1934379 RepID=A0AAN6ZQQ3_9PEZI|nr:ribosomal lysine N-methyltransferase set11 [Dichotomopilus funicola]
MDSDKVIYEKLIEWAETKGVKLNGVMPWALDGRGIGVVAVKNIKEGDQILLVPNSALRSLDTARPEIKQNIPKDASVQAILALELALDKPNTGYDAWVAVTPSRESIMTLLPMVWDHRLHQYLPKPALALLRKQQAKFNRDWAAVQQMPAFAGEEATITRSEFMYYWLLINTRTFYHETPQTALLPSGDKMVLQPVADLFNHGSKGCDVKFTSAGCTITADRAYEVGDEIQICYGRHHNDFLLVEYGFILGGINTWDEACIDDAILPSLNREQRSILEERDFLGNYVLDANEVCYRTQVALRLLCLSSYEEWNRLVTDGEDGGEALQKEVDGRLVDMLERYELVVERKIREVEALEEVGQACQREILVTRWRQILKLVEDTIDRLYV